MSRFVENAEEEEVANDNTDDAALYLSRRRDALTHAPSPSRPCPQRTVQQQVLSASIASPQTLGPH